MLLSLFFQFYYRYTRLLSHILPTITIDGRELWIPPGVYKPLENEQGFREFVREGDRVCDLGCGSGVISLFSADKASEVVALDIGDQAVEATRHNCARHGVDNVVVLRSDMFAMAEGRFDRIFANPPFVEISMDGDDSQWATSTRYLTRLFAEGRDHLSEDGQIVALYPTRKGPRLQELAEAAGFRLVETRAIGPKSPSHWLTCALYMELFFDARFYVFERARGAGEAAA